MIKLILVLCGNPDSKKPDYGTKLLKAFFSILGLPVVLYTLTYQLAQSDWLLPVMERFYGFAAIDRSLSLKPYHLSAAEELVAYGHHKLAVRYYALTAVNMLLLVIICVDLALTLIILRPQTHPAKTKKVGRISPMTAVWMLAIWMLAMGILMLFAGENDFDPPRTRRSERFFVLMGSSPSRPSPNGDLALGDDWWIWMMTAWSAMMAILCLYVLCREIRRRRRERVEQYD